MNTEDKIEELIEQGNEFMDNEDYSKAIAIFGEALSIIPGVKEEDDNYTWLCATIADAYFMDQHYEQSLEYNQKAYNADEVDNPFILLRMGQSHFETRNKEKAVDFLLRAYMLEGEDIFEDEEQKYFDFLKSHVDLTTK